jgi:hypothetical protein
VDIAGIKSHLMKRGEIFLVVHMPAEEIRPLLGHSNYRAIDIMKDDGTNGTRRQRVSYKLGRQIFLISVYEL